MPRMVLPSGNIDVSGLITPLHCPVPPQRDALWRQALHRNWRRVLVALSALTGEVSWERQIGDWTIGQHYSGGPQILDGKVVVGMSGCYYINTGC